MSERQRLGRTGEDAVADYLQARGYKLVARNARAGRLEIDIIAERSGTLVFCEVRSKASGALYSPAETIDYKKQQRLKRAALQWLQQQTPPRRARIRIDAAAVTFEKDTPTIEYYENITME